MLAETELDLAREILVLIGSNFLFNLMFIFSGGGFFVRYHGLWTLRGIVSSASLKNEGGCDVDRYSLYTNVLDYTSWLEEIIENNATLTTRISQRERNDFQSFVLILFISHFSTK